MTTTSKPSEDLVVILPARARPGGAGNDVVDRNPGTFYGDAGDDFVFFNEGTFYGDAGDDSFLDNTGTFYQD